jgi:hypothetical protein
LWPPRRLRSLRRRSTPDLRRRRPQQVWTRRDQFSVVFVTIFFVVFVVFVVPFVVH